MFAFVTQNVDSPVSRKIELIKYDSFYQIAVGSKVSKRRLKKVIAKNGFLCIFSEHIDTRKLECFDLSNVKQELLFEQFCDHIIKSPNTSLSVGINDIDGRFLKHEKLVDVVNSSASTIIFTHAFSDDDCREWIKSVGTCPETVNSKRWLYDCDCVFSADGLSGFNGTLFGKGGKGIDPNALNLPNEYASLVGSGVDPADIKGVLMLNNRFRQPTGIEQFITA